MVSDPIYFAPKFNQGQGFGGKIPNGATVINYAPSSLDFGFVDGVKGFRDGIDLGDTIGTFSGGIKVLVKNNVMYFEAKNSMSTQSFFGGNFLERKFGIQIINPIKYGPAADTVQVFKWQTPLPKQYQTPLTTPIEWRN